jgi:hypothetical protein
VYRIEGERHALAALEEQRANAAEDLREKSNKIAQLNTDIAQAERAQAYLTNALRGFKPNLVPIDLSDLKTLAVGLGGTASAILQRTLFDAHANLKFGLANDPQKGFTSPGYVDFVLKEVGVNKSLSALPERNGQPQNGDIITYSGGYAMFYFKAAGKEFVIGMTPNGIFALPPDFAQMITVRAVLTS